MKQKWFLILFCFQLIFSIFAKAETGWMDRSSSIFFPASLKKTILVNQNFSLFWWNFLVIKKTEKNQKKSDQFCTDLKKLTPELLLRVECKQSLTELSSVLESWEQDYFLRESMPSASILKSKMNETLAQASLPSMNAEMLSLLRADPFSTWKSLYQLVLKRVPIEFKSGSEYIIIPIQFAFPPNETAKTIQLSSRLDSDWYFVGPHSSTLQNESQIKKDLDSVSMVGMTLLCVVIAFLVYFKKTGLLLLFPIVFIGMGISTAVTIIFFGSIHGLTLSFGTGIVGLALDYGFQAVLNSKMKSVWKTNLCGLSTTLAGLLVMLFSGIPLLKQMMFFAIVGLVASFIIFYVMIKWKPSFFQSAPLTCAPKLCNWKAWVSLAFILISVVGFFGIKPNLSLQQFDYQEERIKPIHEWVFKSLGLKPPLFQVHDQAELIQTETEKEWADKQKINIENYSNYLPSQEQQLSNLKTWENGWTQFELTWSKEERSFFSPFLKKISFNPKHDPRSYQQHLFSHQDWLTLWLPKTDEEEKKIRIQFPLTTSLREVVSQFPTMLSQELNWMVPLSVLLALMIHLIYYRRFSFAVIALIPFFTGVGALVIAKFLFNLEISFITVVGLVMVFGFSLDYGIFATDACRDSLHENLNLDSLNGVWTGILYSAIATIAGFFPLLFCVHPVLRQLGQALFFGGVGTYIGSIWGIPSMMKRLKVGKE